MKIQIIIALIIFTSNLVLTGCSVKYPETLRLQNNSSKLLTSMEVFVIEATDDFFDEFDYDHVRNELTHYSGRIRIAGFGQTSEKAMSCLPQSISLQKDHPAKLRSKVQERAKNSFPVQETHSSSRVQGMLISPDIIKQRLWKIVIRRITKSTQAKILETRRLIVPNKKYTRLKFLGVELPVRPIIIPGESYIKLEMKLQYDSIPVHTSTVPRDYCLIIGKCKFFSDTKQNLLIVIMPQGGTVRRNGQAKKPKTQDFQGARRGTEKLAGENESL